MALDIFLRDDVPPGCIRGRQYKEPLVNSVVKDADHVLIRGSLAIISVIRGKPSVVARSIASGNASVGAIFVLTKVAFQMKHIVINRVFI